MKAREPNSVRRCAVALARAVMRDAGLQVSDLAEPPAHDGLLTDGGSSSPPRGVLMPVENNRYSKALARAGMSSFTKPAKLPKVQRAAVPAPVVKFHTPPAAGAAVVPANVKVTICPSGRDTRFTVDPSFEDGERMTDWRARRGMPSPTPGDL